MENYEFQEPVYWMTDSSGQKVYRMAVGHTHDELMDSIGRIFAERQGYKPPEETLTPECPVVLFGGYAREWLDNVVKPHIKFNSFAAEMSRTKKWIEAFEDRPIDTITSMDILKVLNTMSDKKKCYVRAILKTLQRVLDAAVEDGLVSENVAKKRKVRPNGEQSEERRILNDDEFTQAINVFRSLSRTQDKLYGIILLFTGVRPGEALALNWEDINFDTKTISITKSLTTHGSRSEITDPKTKNGVRMIPLSPQMAEIIYPHRGIGGIFRRRNGDLYTQNDRTAMCKRINKALGTAGLRMYSFRHTFATKLAETGINGKSLESVMGHASYTFTMDTYVHTTDAMRQEAADKVMALFDKYDPPTQTNKNSANTHN